MMAWIPRPDPRRSTWSTIGTIVGEALPRTGAGRQYVRPTPLGGLQNRLALVLVQEKLLAAVVRIRLAAPEDPRAFLVKYPLGNQIIDRAAGLERRVQLQQRLWPKPLGSEVAVNKLPDATVADLDEAAGIVPIVRDQTVPEIKNIHDKQRRSFAPAGATRSPQISPTTAPTD